MSGDTTRRPSTRPSTDGPTSNGNGAHGHPLAASAAARPAPVGAATAAPVRALIDELLAARQHAVISFAGQGVHVLDELAALHGEHPDVVGPWLRRAERTLRRTVTGDPVARRTGLYGHGFQLQRWVEDPDSRPDARVLTSSPVSQPLILIVQIARLLTVCREGLGAVIARGREGGIVAGTGHSQGVLPAVFVAECAPYIESERALARAEDYLVYALWQGLHMDLSYRATGMTGTGAPMAAVAGPSTRRLAQHVEAVNAGQPPELRLDIVLHNTRTRHIVSGAPQTLERLRARLERVAERERAARKQGQHGGTVLSLTWEPLPVGAAFHSEPHMRAGLEAMRAQRAERPILEGLRGDALHFDVYSPVDGSRLNDLDDVVDALMAAQFVEPVRWQQTLLATLDQPQAPRWLLELGPGDGVAKLAAVALRATGVDVLALATPAGRAALFTPGATARRPRPAAGADFAPTLGKLPGDRLVVDNRYTRATGQSPIILPGMTPTTVDCPIVTAAANAGFTAELAGGGQVTERILSARLEELAEQLEPGCEVVFNALYLDRYLWDLHLGRQGLVQRARRAGAPISGVTISAGIPEVDEAVALLDELAAIGMHHNAFKPGTVAQVGRVIEIARAARHHTVFVHLEGGRAGGHHSWEDLDELLLSTWHKLRAEPNLVLCVGGGIADEARATALLTGTWAHAHGQPTMPVDAVFLGTLAMACAEATTSPEVKRALVDAAGTDQWVHSGQIEGAVTSGRSQLDADIHYLDNAASRCGRLLDEVAGDADAIAARRDEIIAALALTARPYFGDLEAMTWSEVLERMVELMAIGNGTRYEDGIWPDITYRQRILDAVTRADARLAGLQGLDHTDPIATLADLDRPVEVLAALRERWPQLTTTRLHPADVQWFVRELCARPGKPVNFVPVIDADVRRWYKSDSLWQAHDPRYGADAVLVIPGPEAVAGIRRADEPIAGLLGRFEQAVVDRLVESNAPCRDLTTRTAPLAPAALPTGISSSPEHEGLVLEAIAPNSAVAWFEYLGTRFDGPLATVLSTPTLTGTALPNPVRAVALAEPGAVLRCTTRDQGQTLDALRWLPPGGGEHLEARVVADDAVRVDIVAGESEDAPTLSLTLRVSEHRGARSVCVDAASCDAALRAFYRAVVLGSDAAADPARDLFAPVTAPIVLDDELIASVHGYAVHTGAREEVGHADALAVPHNFAFSLAWRPLFELIAHPELAGGLLRLVHLDNRVQTGPGWPLRAGDALEIEARVTRIEDGARGRTIATRCEVRRDAVVCATIESSFFVRGAFADTPFTVRAHERVRATVRPRDEAAVEFLTAQPWFAALGVTASTDRAVEIDLEVTESRSRGGLADFGAHGNSRDAAAVHPVRAVLEALGDDVTWHDARPPVASSSPVVLLEDLERAPASMETFAEVGGDMNPIHRCHAFARLARLERPIVHGMWTAARLSAAVCRAAGRRGADRLVDYEATFLAPVEPGARLALTVRQVGLSRGHQVLEGVAEVLRPVEDADGSVRFEREPAVRATARVAPPRTAYVLPGQGIQQRGMGMEAYARSRAARRIWERADAFSRARLGFSILQIVRDNPREITVDGTVHAHPAGVLHLTQFTQVAMAVLACAQVAELREQERFVDGAVTCGHSVGEYNALSVVAGVLPLEDVVEIVYQRGMAMHRLVARDAQGRSGYAMGVVRPHHAGMSHAEAEALVARVREQTGEFVEIVNYNVKGRQYSVTGRVAALRALADELERRRRPGGKPPWVEVPGIDVPFHSTVLRDGVADFRRTLQARLPEIDADDLIGRYVPNLVPRPFSLERSFIQEIAELTSSSILTDVLADDAAWTDRSRLARTIVIELLAYQFASPVRWIETQELLLAPVEQGGLGVERIVEIGVGYQPTLTNMAHQTVATLPFAAGVEVFNVEAAPTPETVRLADIDAATAPRAATRAPQPVEAEAATPEKSAAAPPPKAAPVAAPVQTAPIATGVVEAGPAASLRSILALQAKVRPEQVAPTETIDELFEGVSSRRNQVLLDIGAEFDVGAIDGAHEMPIERLAGELETRAAGYLAPGRYLRAAQDEAIKRVFGRAGLTRVTLAEHLDSHWGLDDGLQARVFDAIALETRDGASTRGGDLGTAAGQAPASRAEATALVDRLVDGVGRSLGVTLSPVSAAGGGGDAAVDAAVVRELEQRIVGRDGVLMQAARDLAERLGYTLDAQPGQVSSREEIDSVAAILAAELGADFAGLVAPAFQPLRHVALTSSWAFARRDVASLYFDAVNGRLEGHALDREVQRLQIHGDRAEIRDTARWYAERARQRDHDTLAGGLDRIAEGGATPVAVVPARPEITVSAEGRVDYQERAQLETGALTRWVESLFAGDVTIGDDGAHDAVLRDVLDEASARPMSFAGRTALVTGASPGSIAIEAVAHLLRGGARVVVTTSNLSTRRLDQYRELYREHAVDGAELHVVPFNQASRQDVEALCDWLFDEVTEQSGATLKTIKRPWSVDLVLPFAAMKDLATMDQLEVRSEAALRALLVGVERLVAGLAVRHLRRGVAAGRAPLHVVLPLSPNHGAFGGDGTYAEGKAALEAMLAKWHSEQDAWARAVTLIGACIGWVRGTGLMDANNLVAPGLEARCGLRTFSNGEMGLLIAGLCSDALREASRERPIRADLSGGFARLGESLPEEVAAVRAELDATVQHHRRLTELRQAVGQTAPTEQSGGRVSALPNWPRPNVDAPSRDAGRGWPALGSANLDETVVIVGLGELGPYGSARTRFEVEVDDRLSAAGVIELAWTTGLIRFETSGRGAGQWVDAETGESVAEHEIAERYETAVRERVGVRFVDPSVTGFDPETLSVLTTAWLDRDFTFAVGSEAEAHEFYRADPEHTRIGFDEASQSWQVTRMAGTEVRVPRRVALDRRVAGQLPTGFDPARYGIPRDMIESLDPVSIYNLIATVEAFLSAGLTPEALLSAVHPARVANTQGAGMGGMRSIRRMYVDHLLGNERQSDVLQESLINVVAAYVVQSYVGSYGPMTHPVAACATAAVSLEEGYDKIMADKADFVVAGAFDDLGPEGMVGFADMNATAHTDDMLARGIEPAAMSRANDRRRRGFVEAQGGGTALLTRASIALELGLPVYGVLAQALSFGDGVHKSIPAPGRGLLASAMGGQRSPLARALRRFGLTADDIALVYKHDTSTNANDPNENALHDEIQRALGRTAGNPLFVVSQKSLTGHSKGGAAAWQLNGLCQAMLQGAIAGNRNLESVDDAMRRFGHLVFSDRSMHPGQAEPLRAGVLTSLGFGHVSSIALVLHRDAFHALVPDDQLEGYLTRLAGRLEAQQREHALVLMGERPMFERRNERRFEAPDNSVCQGREETALLLDANARLDPTRGVFGVPTLVGAESEPRS